MANSPFSCIIVRRTELRNKGIGESGIFTNDIDTQEQAKRAAEALAEVKGKEIVILDLTHLTTFADFFVIAAGDSHVHMKALSDRVRESMAQFGARIVHSEGQGSKTWMLLDFGSVIVHIFSPAARDYYGLEQLWGDAKTIPYSS
ncbi:MAG: ribosome silencing factor [Candidatus Omnitrophica bacterium]|nr:ribosome silencing factor [Candidatus Omnitrophota bacterium]